MRDLICPDTHPEAPSLRCWKRDGHDGDCLTVIPNLDRETLTRPQAVRWTNPNGAT